MLTRDDIYVGNIIEYATLSRWVITEVFRVDHSGFRVAIRGVVSHVPSYVGFYRDWSVVNNNRITVSSLDYQSNDELDDKDKEIIKEYLNGCH